MGELKIERDEPALLNADVAVMEIEVEGDRRLALPELFEGGLSFVEGIDHFWVRDAAFLPSEAIAEFGKGGIRF